MIRFTSRIESVRIEQYRASGLHVAAASIAKDGNIEVVRRKQEVNSVGEVYLQISANAFCRTQQLSTQPAPNAIKRSSSHHMTTANDVKPTQRRVRSVIAAYNFEASSAQLAVVQLIHLASHSGIQTIPRQAKRGNAHQVVDIPIVV